MGGAMDLVASAENIIVAMQHTNRSRRKQTPQRLFVTAYRCCLRQAHCNRFRRTRSGR